MDMSSLDFGETRGDELILVALDRDGNEVETEDLSLLWVESVASIAPNHRYRLSVNAIPRHLRSGCHR
jgi:hypothetical protein